MAFGLRTVAGGAIGLFCGALIWLAVTDRLGRPGTEAPEAGLAGAARAPGTGTAPAVESPANSPANSPVNIPVAPKAETAEVATPETAAPETAETAEVATPATAAPEKEEAAEVETAAAPTGTGTTDATDAADVDQAKDAVAQDAVAGEAAGEGTAAPRFTTVRADAAGGLVVAGQALPGAEVLLLSGEAVLGRAVANARGDFAIFADLPSADQGGELRLSALGADGAAKLSSQSVLVAPRPAAAPQPVSGTDAPGSSASATASGVTAAQGAGAVVAEAPTVLLREGDRVSLLSAPTATPATGDVVLDTIAYDADGAVVLTGRAPAGTAAIHVLADGREAATGAPGVDGGWSLRIEGLEGGVYRLVIEARAVDGRMLSRFATPFQREEPAALARAAAAAPAAAGGTEAVSEATGAGESAGEVPGGTTGARLVLITVQPGYTLWGIADDSYGRGMDYVRVYEANRDQIRNPDLIYPGQVFRLPQQ